MSKDYKNRKKGLKQKRNRRRLKRIKEKTNKRRLKSDDRKMELTDGQNERVLERNRFKLKIKACDSRINKR